MSGARQRPDEAEIGQDAMGLRPASGQWPVARRRVAGDPRGVCLARPGPSLRAPHTRANYLSALDYDYDYDYDMIVIMIMRPLGAIWARAGSAAERVSKQSRLLVVLC